MMRMATNSELPGGFWYAYASYEEERELCRLELSALLKCDIRASAIGHAVRAVRAVPVSRSVFTKQRLQVACEAQSLDRIAEFAAGIDVQGCTFKVVALKSADREAYADLRGIERRIGARISGQADVKQPQLMFGIVRHGCQWLFGPLELPEPAWLHHNRKPVQYSTALSTRMARAVANIAVPDVEGATLIDPCCGIGTVLIEALSMGIQCVGSDRNPLALRGARANLAHFGMPDIVKRADMRELTGSFTAGVLDLPYNRCSVLPREERLAMLRAMAKLAQRAVVVAAGDLALSELGEAGLVCLDACEVPKGEFRRTILLCQSRPDQA